MSSYDLLDIYTILIHIRFSLESEESLHLVTLLTEALYLKLGNMLDNQCIDNKFIRRYILKKEIFAPAKLGTFDDHYPSGCITFKEPYVIFSFFMIIYSIKEHLINRKYHEAFVLVDRVHNYPTDVLLNKKNAKKELTNTLKDLLKGT